MLQDGASSIVPLSPPTVTNETQPSFPVPGGASHPHVAEFRHFPQQTAPANPNPRIVTQEPQPSFPTPLGSPIWTPGATVISPPWILTPRPTPPSPVATLVSSPRSLVTSPWPYGRTLRPSTRPPATPLAPANMVTPPWPVPYATTLRPPRPPSPPRVVTSPASLSGSRPTSWIIPESSRAPTPTSTSTGSTGSTQRCGLCSKTIRADHVAMRAHFRRQHPEGDYCLKCPSVFRDKALLYFHYQTEHKDYYISKSREWCQHCGLFRVSGGPYRRELHIMACKRFNLSKYNDETAPWLHDREN